MLKFVTLVLYLLTYTLGIDSMSLLKADKRYTDRHPEQNANSKISNFDPAPSNNMRRKRRVAGREGSIIDMGSPSSTIEKMAQEALKKFFQNNALKASATTTTSKRPEVTLLPFDISKSVEDQKTEPVSNIVVKRSTGTFTLQKPSPNPAQQIPKQDMSLPIEVVDSLVMSIQKNNNQNLAEIIQDLHSKLDMVSSMKVGPVALRQRVDDVTTVPVTTMAAPTTSKPKNIIKEMDTILEDFLRAGQEQPTQEPIIEPTATNQAKSTQESSSEASDEEAVEEEAPYVPRARDDEEDLAFDIDGSELAVAWKRE